MRCAAAHKANWAKPRGSGGGPWELNGPGGGGGVASAADDGWAPGPGRRDRPVEARAGGSRDAVVAVTATVSRGRGRAVPWPARGAGPAIGRDAVLGTGPGHGGPVGRWGVHRLGPRTATARRRPSPQWGQARMSRPVSRRTIAATSSLGRTSGAGWPSSSRQRGRPAGGRRVAEK